MDQQRFMERPSGRTETLTQSSPNRCPRWPPPPWTEGVLDHARTTYGVARSLWIYYANRHRTRAMRAFYRPFVGTGDLVFDIGSHVGDRVACFRRLGARVVAVEPQPSLVRVLRLLYGRDERVTLHEAAVGAREGTLELHLNVLNPTVSTASTAFIAAAATARGWDGQRWNRTREVCQVTLDGLMARHGRPAFVKIDVEGLEAEVMAGLSAALPALSFEFTTLQPGVATSCVARCTALGWYEFNAAIGESQRLEHPRWLDADAIVRWLRGLPESVNSGDVYARLVGDG